MIATIVGRLGVLGLAVLGPAAVAAQAHPVDSPRQSLSLEEALALAEENNPAFQQQRNDVDVARSAVRTAYGRLLPSVGASSSFDYTASGERRYGSVEFGKQPDYYGSSYSLGLNYELSGSTLLQPSVERSQKHATERRVVGVAANLEAQVTQQYLVVLQAREQVAQAEREVARTEEHVRLAQARLDVGAGTPLDLRRAEVQKGRAEVSLVQARNNAATQVLTLGQVVGVPLDPGVELSSGFTLFDPEWEVEPLVDMALLENPVLLAARSSLDAARTSVGAARSTYLPSLNFQMGLRGTAYQAGDISPLVNETLGRMQGAYQQCLGQNDIRTRVGLAPVACRNPNEPSVEQAIRESINEQNNAFPFDYTRQPLFAAVSVSLPIFQGFSRQLQVDQAKAAAVDAQHEVRAQELRLKQEVSTAVLNLEAAYETARLQEKVLEAAAEELRLATERFRFGAASSVEVTDAQTSLAAAERDLIDSVYNFHRSLAALEALAGRPLRGP